MKQVAGDVMEDLKLIWDSVTHPADLLLLLEVVPLIPAPLIKMKFNAGDVEMVTGNLIMDNVIAYQCWM